MSGEVLNNSVELGVSRRVGMGLTARAVMYVVVHIFFSIDLVQTESHEKCHISICM